MDKPYGTLSNNPDTVSVFYIKRSFFLTSAWRCVAVPAKKYRSQKSKRNRPLTSYLSLWRTEKKKVEKMMCQQKFPFSFRMKWRTSEPVDFIKVDSTFKLFSKESTLARHTDALSCTNLDFHFRITKREEKTFAMLGSQAINATSINGSPEVIIDFFSCVLIFNFSLNTKPVSKEENTLLLVMEIQICK